ncbi:hypothetical protein PR202_ga23846 [Eleusine coracana subsp. coracana]|uniref:Uncharacterized protein n=1 Tax=Eleusine coracana subsp. coracana TaxID=191504 RepID=A0AAV5D6Y7_ELECO|nr:hypothetical protein PR202_ga23846 [Eleusine coracana subsp. coracana]
MPPSSCASSASAPRRARWLRIASGPPPRPRCLLGALPRRPARSLRCRAIGASRPAAAVEEDGLEDEEESYFSVTSSGLSEVDYLGESTRGDLNVRRKHLEALVIIGSNVVIFMQAWEGRAYDYGMENLKSMGFPVDDLQFDPDLVVLLVIRGLIIDKEKGNLVKADRFGYIKRAMHGTQMLSTRAVRWIDKLDQGLVPAELGPLDYKGLYNAVYRALFRAHVEGQLKSEIMAEPERFVEPDPELPLALLDQKEIDALVKSYAQKEELVTLIQQKEIVGDLFNQLRLALQRRTNSRPAQVR